MHYFTGALTLTDLDNIYDYTFADDHAFGGHRHAAWELNAVLDGQLQVTDESRVILLRGGDALLLEPERFHRNCVRRGASAVLVVLQFYTDDLPRCGEARRFRIPPSAALVMQALRAEYAGFCARTGGTLRESADCPAVLRQLSETFLAMTVADEVPPYYGHDRLAETYRAAVEYMTRHIAEPLTTQALARACCVSPSTLKSAFARCAGQGAMHYLAELRLRRAKQLLRSGRSVQSTAAALGYSSPSYFSQAISAATGELVAPDGNGTTQGTVKLDFISGKWIYSTTIAHTTGANGCSFKDVTCDSSIGAAAKLLLQALAMLPDAALTGDGIDATYGGDYFYINNAEAERCLIRGGGWYDGGRAGVFDSGLVSPRSSASGNVGGRSAFYE